MVDVPGPVTVIVDYAHTPDGLGDSHRERTAVGRGRRVLVVFGCGGDRDRAKRPVMGAVAHAQADFVVVTSDNPRGETSGRHNRTGSRRDPGPDHGRLVEPDSGAALELALDMAAPGDVVLIAGKGHENYIEASGRRYPFDDRTEARFAAARSLDRRRIHTYKGSR